MSVALAPVQIVADELDASAVGKSFTVNVTWSVAEQPFPSVPVTD
mgnify:CR=1 FL=1